MSFAAVFLVNLLSAPAVWPAPDEVACPAFRLDQGGSMTHVPVRRQPPQLCAHYVLTEMIDAWRFSHEPTASTSAGRIHSSPFELAVAFSAFMKEPLHTDSAIKEVDRFLHSEHPYLCDERVISPKKSSTDRDDTYGEMLLDYWRNYSRYLEKQSAELAQSRKPIELGEIFGRGSWQAAQKLKCDVFPNGGFATKQLAALIRENHPMAYLSALFNSACEKHRVPLSSPPLRVEQFSSGQVSMMSNRVNALVSKTPAQPVAINFCANVYKEPAYRGYTRIHFDDDCVQHFTVIIGQRFDTASGECQLLVQESQGPTCDPSYFKEWECKDGKVWIDRRAILGNTKYVYHLAH